MPYRTEAQYRTDLSVNYQYRVGGGADVFFHAEVLNIFNQFQLCGCGGTVFNNGGGSDMRTINNGVLTAANSGTLQPFNPFTTTPVQGVNWNLELDLRHGREPLCVHEPADVPVQLRGEVLDSVRRSPVLGPRSNSRQWTED